MVSECGAQCISTQANVWPHHHSCDHITTVVTTSPQLCSKCRGKNPGLVTRHVTSLCTQHPQVPLATWIKVGNGRSGINIFSWWLPIWTVQPAKMFLPFKISKFCSQVLFVPRSGFVVLERQFVSSGLNTTTAPTVLWRMKFETKSCDRPTNSHVYCFQEI